MHIHVRNCVNDSIDDLELLIKDIKDVIKDKTRGAFTNRQFKALNEAFEDIIEIADYQIAELKKIYHWFRLPDKTTVDDVDLPDDLVDMILSEWLPRKGKKYGP